MSGLVIAFILLDGSMRLVPLDVCHLDVEADGYFRRPRASVGSYRPRGGAIASHLRLGDPIFTHTLFGFYLGLPVWGGLYLRDSRLRGLISLREP